MNSSIIRIHIYKNNEVLIRSEVGMPVFIEDMFQAFIYICILLLLFIQFNYVKVI